MTKEAAKTGADPTFIVAIEQYFPEDQRIIDDKVAYNILSLSTEHLHGLPVLK